MSKTLTLTLDLAAQSALIAQLPPAARQPTSGFTYADGTMSVPEGWVDSVSAIVSVPGWEQVGARASLVAYAADLRWRREVGGVVVAGVAIATDDRSKLMLTGARVAAQADPEWTTIWHGADGQTSPIDAEAMIAISDAVQAHVNAGFATFAAVKVAIEAGTITDEAAIDAAFA